ncbi:MAG: hypothetical protein IT337_18060 [Thermomicrobiales bacterium]|nr:hypothetical protein [Thermomicrobiales bacterium]
MGGFRIDHQTIVVVAHPERGRALEAVLRSAGYEVHRTPGETDLRELAARVWADLVIIALDIPWFDAAAAIRRLLAGSRPIPMLLLGDANPVGLDDIPRLPLTVGSETLLAATATLVATEEVREPKSIPRPIVTDSRAEDDPR